MKEKNISDVDPASWSLFLNLALQELRQSSDKVESFKFVPAWCTKQRRQWHPTLVPLPGKSHGGRSLVGCSPWGREESDTTEWLHFHFALSRAGEGNGNPLQCSCLKNPRDGGAWWAAIYGVAQSQTRLKQFSGISSSVQNDAVELSSSILWIPGP